MLSDDQVNAVIADSLAHIILLDAAGELFGKTLEVAERDSTYGAPTSWLTSEALTEPEQILVAIQAALDWFYYDLVSTKTSQTIKKGDEEWTYSLSAQVMSDRLRALREERDAALTALGGATGVEWVSFVQARDARTSALVEPYVGGSGVGGQSLDPRGFG